jgi:hypothetical protein
MFNVIPYKIAMTFIIEIEKQTLKFIWVHSHKRPQGVKAILSKMSNTQLQTILESQQNKQTNSMVLAQKKTLRPVEENRGLRHESTQLCPSDF